MFLKIQNPVKTIMITLSQKSEMRRGFSFHPGNTIRRYSCINPAKLGRPKSGSRILYLTALRNCP